eukprot:TRINITY_DN5888_c0_g1_i1.p1 TRINITY_DN5888_c0_g1~~TRINITY_DN5888_c0_g1_i1.p1  ORF type:complete len:628 (+),score=190.06 TRINITY_DN5888_c0_g1_i1:273-1886(+)
MEAALKVFVQYQSELEEAFQDLTRRINQIKQHVEDRQEAATSYDKWKAQYLQQQAKSSNNLSKSPSSDQAEKKFEEHKQAYEKLNTSVKAELKDFIEQRYVLFDRIFKKIISTQGDLFKSLHEAYQPSRALLSESPSVVEYTLKINGTSSELGASSDLARSSSKEDVSVQTPDSREDVIVLVEADLTAEKDGASPWKKISPTTDVTEASGMPRIASPRKLSSHQDDSESDDSSVHETVLREVDVENVDSASVDSEKDSKKKDKKEKKPKKEKKKSDKKEKKKKERNDRASRKSTDDGEEPRRKGPPPPSSPKPIRSGNQSSLMGSQPLGSSQPYGSSQSQNSNEGRVFGRRLSEVGNPKVPAVVTQCIDYLSSPANLSEEGILRQSGSKALIDKWKQDYDDGQQVQFEKTDPHAVAGLLKSFFRELPEPIIPSETNEKMAAVIAQQNDPEITANISMEFLIDSIKMELLELLQRIPQENYEVLKMLVEFLRSVEAKSAKNKMTTTNILTCLAPSLRVSPGIIKFCIEDMEFFFPKNT